jgi:cytochrome c553
MTAYLAVLLAIGLLVAASGAIPVGANVNDWPLARRVLEFAKRRSFATHSAGVRPPALDDPALVLRGAGHYETTCRACHGAPPEPVSRISFGMHPAPPNLARRVSTWEDGELFSIVKHGIALSGMPAWPAPERDDEVWAMVAFLRVLPALGPAEYQRLVFGDGAEVPASVAACARCHGVDGNGRGVGAFPRLAGQSSEYLRRSLEAFARDGRHSGIMRPVAIGLSAEAMRALADYYASREPRAGVSPARDEAGEGARIAREGIPRQGVPSCADCHGPGPGPRNPAYPSLAGQVEAYLAMQLELFAEGRRGGTRYAHIMQQVAPRMKPEQMRAVAAYYASLNGMATTRDSVTASASR